MVPLKVYYFNTGCCAEEIINTMGATYDIERLGIQFVKEPELADLLLIGVAVTKKLKQEIVATYEKMYHPKYVIALGACAISGGVYQKSSTYGVEEGLDRVLPVDLYIPGCPPRPESIMHGIIKLQESICGHKKNDRNNRSAHR